MKKIEEDLLKLKIFIDTSSDSDFQEIALLVDNHEFLRLLPKLRKDFEINKLIPLSEFNNKAYGVLNESNKKKKIDFTKYKNPEALISFAKKNETMIAEAEIDEEADYWQFIYNEINLICLQFKRPPYFDDAIRQAIFCGKVNDEVFRPTSVNIIENGLTYSTSASFDLPQLAIFISPTTTYEDIKGIFQYARSLFKSDKRLSYYKPKTDFVNNIRQYRLWYWQRLEGKTFQKIADDYIESKLPARYNTTYLDVMKGVKIYQKLLNS